MADRKAKLEGKKAALLAKAAQAKQRKEAKAQQEAKQETPFEIQSLPQVQPAQAKAAVFDLFDSEEHPNQEPKQASSSETIQSTPVVAAIPEPEAREQEGNHQAHEEQSEAKVEARSDSAPPEESPALSVGEEASKLTQKIEELEAQLLKNQEQIKLLNDEKDSLLSQLTNSTAEEKMFQEQLHLKESRIQELQNEISKLQEAPNSEIATLNERIQSLDQDIATRTEEKRALQGSMDVQLGELNSRISVLESELTNLEQQNAQLTEEKAGFERELVDMAAIACQLKEKEETILSLNLESQNLQLKLQEAQEELQTKLKALEVALTEKQEQYEALEREKTSLQTSLKETQDASLDLQSRLVSLEAEKEALAKSQTDDLKEKEDKATLLASKLEDFEQKFRENNATMEALLAEKAHIQRNYDQKCQVEAEMTDQLNAITSQLTTVNENSLKIGEERDSLFSQLDTLKNEQAKTFQDLETQISQLQSTLNENNAERSNLSEQIQTLNETISQHKSEIGTLDQQKQHLQTELESLRLSQSNDNDEIATKIRDTQSELQEKQDQILTVQKERAVLEKLHQEIQEANTQLDSQIKELQTEKGRLTARVEELQSAATKEQEERTQLEHQLKELQIHFDEFQRQASANQEISKQIESLQQEVQQLNKEKQDLTQQLTTSGAESLKAQEIKSSLDDLSAQLKLVTEEKQSLEQTNSSLLAQITQFQALLDQARDEHKNLKESSLLAEKGLQDSLLELQEKLKELEKCCFQLEQTITALGEEKHKLEDALASTESNQFQDLANLNALKQDLQQKQDMIDQLQREKEEIQTQITDAHQSTQKVIEGLEIQTNALHEERRILQESKAELETALNSLNLKVDSLTQEKGALEAQLQSETQLSNQLDMDLTKATQDLQSLTAQIENLREEKSLILSQMNHQSVDTQKQIESLQERLSLAAESVKQKDGQLKEQVVLVSNYMDEIRKLKVQAKKLTEAQGQSNSSMAGMEESLLKEKQAFTLLQKQSEIEIDRLKTTLSAEITSLKEELQRRDNQIQHQAQIWSQERSSLEQQLHSEISRQQEQQLLIEDLTRQRGGDEAQSTSLKEEIASLNQSLASQQKKWSKNLQILENDKKQAEKKVKEREAEIETIKREKERLAALTDVQDQQSVTQNKTIQDLTHRCNELTISLQTLHSDRASFQNQIEIHQTELEHEISSLKLKNDELSNALQGTKATLQEAKTLSNELQQTARSGQQTIEILENQISILNQEVVDKNHQSQNLTQQIKELQTMVLKLQLANEKQALETAKPVEQLVQETSHLQETINQQNLALAQLKQENERLILTGRAEDYDKLNVIVEILKREKVDLTAQLEKLSKMNDQLMSERAMWANRQNNVAGQAELLTILSKEKQDLSNMLFQKTLQLEKLNNEKNEMREKISTLSKINSMEVIKQQEETIAQLHTVIDELKLRLGDPTTSFGTEPPTPDDMSVIDIHEPIPATALVPVPQDPPQQPQAQGGWMSSITQTWWYILGY